MYVYTYISVCIYAEIWKYKNDFRYQESSGEW